MKKRKLTPFKLISGLLAGILIITICIIIIVQKINKNDNTYWQELVLIGLAIFFLIIIIKGAIQYKLENNKQNK